MFLQTTSFHQAIAHINDSSNFDSSFEVKYIPTPEEHFENHCINQFDREALMRFVQEFESLQIYNTSAKSTPKKPSPVQQNHNDEELNALHDKIIAEDHTTSHPSLIDHPELRDYRGSNLWSSNGDLLLMDHQSVYSLNSTRSNSSEFLRSTMGCKPVTCCDQDQDLDDGIELMASNPNSSADLSFDMHPPLLPSFNVTPPPKQSRCAAYELARFLRGSFHVKRAKITHLRRSLSENESLQLQKAMSKESCLKAKKKILEDTTNHHNQNALSPRNLPKINNTSPFRRVWENSSLRSPRGEKYIPSPSGQRRNSTSVQSCNTFMIATDNERNLLTYPGLGGKDITKRATLSLSDKVIHSKCPRVSSWAISFEHLLEDPAGLATFAEFLKMEFSAENIYFWTSCERYRNTDSLNERQTQAKQIFGKYISNGCSEPVNLDAHTRNMSDEDLHRADTNLFATAQKQIFHLMKFDSYQRFIRSDLYKSCQKAEEKGQTLPYGVENLDVLLKTNFSQSASPKLKKSASNAEDRRRKILLPWHRKTRSKSRDRMDLLIDATTPPPISHRETSHGSASALNSIVLHSSKLTKLSAAKSSEDCYSQTLRSSLPSSLKSLSSGCSLCRVKFSDDATTIVQIKPSETVGQLIDRLLEKRGLNYQMYDVLIKSINKSMDLQMSSMELAGEEVYIDQRVTFKLYLPDPKVISVKSKPKKYLHEVARPILEKYNYNLDEVDILRRDNMEKVDLLQLVTAADGQRLLVVPRQPMANSNNDSDYQNDNISQNVLLASKEISSEFLTKNAKNNARIESISSECNLDEPTDDLYEDIQNEKCRPESLTHYTDQYSLKSDEWGSNNSVFYDTPTNKANKHTSSSTRLRGKSLTNVLQHSNDPDVSKPIIAKLKAGVKLQVTEIVAEKQDELLISLKSRLDNQSLPAIGSQFKEPTEYIRNRENINETALNLRNIRANLSPISKANTLPQPSMQSNSTLPPPLPTDRPVLLMRQKYPNPKTNSDEELQSSTNADETSAAYKGPPPLPPKPKVLPTKPSNWGANLSD